MDPPEPELDRLAYDWAPLKFLGASLGPVLLSLAIYAALHRQAPPPPSPEPPAPPSWAEEPLGPSPPVGMPDEPADAGELSAVAHQGLGCARARLLGQKLLPLQAGLPMPHGADWRAWFQEGGQTLHDYILSGPNRPSPEHTTIYVEQLGEFTPEQQALADAAAEALGLFYGLPVRRLEPLGLARIAPDYRRAHDARYGEQLYTSAVLALLQERRPADAVAVLALTASDLWPGGDWNFVFGQASLEERVGVWSLARFGDPQREPAQVTRRVVQVALHETGHMLGLPHCVYARCGMNGSNSLAESDRNPVPFCLQDEMKVWWACPVEPVARYRALSAFAARHGLEAEARFWARSAEALAP